MIRTVTSAEKTVSSFLRELKRRKVMQTSIFYILVCWGALQVGDIIFPAVGLDADKASRNFLYIAILGFPVNFIFSWYFQLTSSGIVRTTSFIERRVLRNISPINDQRHGRMSAYFQKDADLKESNWIISAETGPLTGLSFGVSDSIVVGRSLDSDIAIISPHVSRHHARLELEEERLVVEDLGSSNGTVVNGKSIQGRQALHHEDELRFHDIIFRVTESYSRPRQEKESMNQTTFIDTTRLEDETSS